MVNPTKKEMLDLFDAVTSEIQHFGGRTSLICSAIRKLIEQSDDLKEDGELAKLKAEIDAMTQEELCRKWRFSNPGDPMFLGEAGVYFSKRLQERGGMTPEISKKIGW